MEKSNSYEDQKFDSYLNKIIISTSKRYFKKQVYHSKEQL